MAKDVKVKQPVHVSGGLTKQDIIIADETGRATLTLWESDVETVMANLLYQFNNIIVHEYQGINIYHFLRRMRQYRTFPTLVMFPRKDLSECDDDDLIIHVAEVISVLTWQTFRACVMCKAKVQTTTENPGSCTKCSRSFLVVQYVYG